MGLRIKKGFSKGVLLFLLAFISFIKLEAQDLKGNRRRKDTTRNAIGVELLGRCGGLYSISYRRKFGDSLLHWSSFNASFIGGPEICLAPSYSFIPWGKGIFKLKVGLTNPHYFNFRKSPGNSVDPAFERYPFYQWAILGELGGHFAVSSRIAIELNGLVVLYYNTPLVDSYPGWISIGNIWGGLQVNYRF